MKLFSERFDVGKQNFKLFSLRRSSRSFGSNVHNTVPFTTFNKSALLKRRLLLFSCALRENSSRRSSSVFIVRNFKTSKFIEEATTVKPNRINVNESIT